MGTRWPITKKKKKSSTAKTVEKNIVQGEPWGKIEQLLSTIILIFAVKKTVIPQGISHHKKKMTHNLKVTKKKKSYPRKLPNPFASIKNVMVHLSINIKR